MSARKWNSDSMTWPGEIALVMQQGSTPVWPVRLMKVEIMQLPLRAANPLGTGSAKGWRCVASPARETPLATTMSACC